MQRNGWFVLGGVTLVGVLFMLFGGSMMRPAYDEGAYGVKNVRVLSQVAEADSQKTREPASAEVKASVSSSSTGTAEREAAISPARALRQNLDWKKYPGTLGDQVAQALANRDGPMAADLAGLLRECDVLQALHANPGGPAVHKTPGAQNVMVERIQEEQANLAACQTIIGSKADARSELLSIATEKKVMGAASDLFSLGVRRDDVIGQMVADGAAGHLQSLILVTGHSASEMRISKQQQFQLRLGFQIAADSVNTANVVSTQLNIAKSLAKALAKEEFPRIDSPGLAEADRAAAGRVAAMIEATMQANSRP